MNECEHISVGTCKILSKEKSNSFNSGSLVVQGGIGCGENLYVKKSILCKNIGSDKNIISFENNIKFYNNIIPENNQISFGNNKEFFNSIFSRNLIFKNSLVGNNVNIQNLNVDNNCLLGSNNNKLKRGIEECLLNIDSRKNCITFNSPDIKFKDPETNNTLLEIRNDSINFESIININNEDETIVSFNPIDKKVLINGELFVSSNIIKSFRKISVGNGDKLNLDTEILLLKIDSSCDISLNLKTDNLTIGTTKKIIIYYNINNININLDDLITLNKESSGIEILFDGKKWIIISKFT